MSFAGIALIGLRGAGKSTLGKMLAKKIGWSFVELNKEIEAQNGFSVAEIIALYGQEGFRRMEQAALGQLLARKELMVLATGGGIVSEPLTFDLILSSFYTIWLKAEPEEHMARVRGQGDLRPMADDRSAMAELRNILVSREPLYARASAVVDTAGLSRRRRRRAAVRRGGAGAAERSADVRAGLNVVCWQRSRLAFASKLSLSRAGRLRHGDALFSTPSSFACSEGNRHLDALVELAENSDHPVERKTTELGIANARKFRIAATPDNFPHQRVESLRSSIIRMIFAAVTAWACSRPALVRPKSRYTLPLPRTNSRSSFFI